MNFLKSAVIFSIISISSAVSLHSDFAGDFENAKSHFREGLTLFNKMNYLASAEYFRKAVTVYPEYHTAREYLARAYRMAGYSDEAMNEWEKLSDISDSPSVKNKIDVLSFLSSADYSEKNFTDEFNSIRSVRSKEVPGGRFSYPMDAVCDSEKNLYITSFTSGKIVKFDLNGKYIDSYKSAFGGKIYGIDFYNGLFIYTDFKNDSAAIVDSNFKVKMKIGSSGSGDAEFHGPQGCAFDDSGSFFVVDSENHRVQKFSKDGKFVFSFGRNGTYEGELSSPTDITVITDTIYVTDTGNRRIAVFDKSGNFVKNIAIDIFDTPKGISKNNGNLVISDNMSGIIFYNPVTEENIAIKEFADDKSFVRVNSVCFDRDGVMYALDHAAETIEVMIPLRKRYSNLDIEISSIDTSHFPSVAVYLNIRNRDGSPVYSLSKDNFVVKEDNARMKSFYTDYFSSVKKRAKTVLCVDRSSSMQQYQEEISWVSDIFLREMKKDDKLKVVSFNSDISVSNDFDWSRLRALRALRQKDYAEGKNIGKALYNSIDDLIDDEHRRSVILITDGKTSDDSFSKYSISKIINYARNHFININVISFETPSDEIRNIAEATGGKIIAANRPDLVKKLYSDIKNSEEYRYALVYDTYKSSKKFKNWWSDIRIEVDVNGQSGTEWGGYFVP
ncbi:MAG TPA: VWA domain-containing protein [Spirochaetota bacterium]|nr:VWA domain-containing protein [Spirochaetota bacterium]